MKNSKFTKGEWFIEENVDHYPFIMGDDNNTIAMLFEKDGSLLYGRTHQETAANAKLIAAAPELLDALLSAYKCSGEKNYLTEPVLDKIKNAIKKATE